jgi:hypothetical protein
MSKKPLTKEQKQANRLFRESVRNSVGELNKPIYPRFGPIKRCLDHIVLDENSRIIAAFPSEESAKAFQKMRGLKWNGSEWA